jgi:exopolysaccharide production protein ExoQ
MPSSRLAFADLTVNNRTENCGILMQSVFAVGLIFISSAFVLQLAYDASTVVALQIITALTGIVGLSIIVTSPKALDLARRCWPILALVALAFVSTTWSLYPSQTFRKSYTLLSTVLFALAIVGRLAPADCIRLILRVMVLECILSIIWVVIFPEIALQDRTGLGEGVAGVSYWRGIFSHKQGLGVVAGLTTGLLMFYGSVAFRSPIIRIAAILPGVVCLMGTGSVTGILTVIVTSTSLYWSFGIARMASGVRNLMLNLTLLAIAFILIVWNHGSLDFLPVLFGKSADLSGRTIYSEIAMDVFRSSGATLFGGGYAVGLSRVFPEDVYVDDGYVDLLMQFGYLGSAVIIAIVFWLVVAGKRLIVATSPDQAALSVFPMGIMMVLAFINISESNFLASKHLSTVFVVLVVAVIVQARFNKRAKPNRKASSRTTFNDLGQSAVVSGMSGQDLTRSQLGERWHSWW